MSLPPEPGQYDQPDPDDPRARRIIGQLTHFNPDDPRNPAFGEFLKALREFQDAARPGYSKALTEPVNRHARMRQMIDFCWVEGQPWNDVEDVLGIYWPTQVRVFGNGHDTPLWDWDAEDRADYEADARKGMSIRRLEREYALPYHQTCTITRLFRGPL